MVTVPVPVRASVRDLLRDLLGTPVTVTEGFEQTLGDGAPAYLGTYCRDDGTPVAVTITNFSAIGLKSYSAKWFRTLSNSCE